MRGSASGAGATIFVPNSPEKRWSKRLSEAVISGDVGVDAAGNSLFEHTIDFKQLGGEGEEVVTCRCNRQVMLECWSRIFLVLGRKGEDIAQEYIKEDIVIGVFSPRQHFGESGNTVNVPMRSLQRCFENEDLGLLRGYVEDLMCKLGECGHTCSDLGKVNIGQSYHDGYRFKIQCRGSTKEKLCALHRGGLSILRLPLLHVCEGINGWWRDYAELREVNVNEALGHTCSELGIPIESLQPLRPGEAAEESGAPGL